MPVVDASAASNSVEKAIIHGLAYISAHGPAQEHLYNNGIVDLLEAICSTSNDHFMEAKCAKILACLSATKSSFKNNFRDLVSCSEYWLENKFPEWVAGTNLKLKSAASKILLNLYLSEDYDVIYNDGVHLLDIPEEDHEVDVVFVHGLRGGSFRTWRKRYDDKDITDPETLKCWPNEYLKPFLEKSGLKPRLISVGYNAPLTTWSKARKSATNTVEQHAEGIKKSLLAAGVGKRPVIFVTHSMGGLVLKNVLTNLEENDEAEENLLNNTRGIAFLAVPHKGSPMAKLSPKMLGFLTRVSPTINDLKENNNTLQQLNDSFLNVLPDHVEVLNLAEGQTTDCGVIGEMMVVPSSSAFSCISKNCKCLVLDQCTHFDICKIGCDDGLDPRWTAIETFFASAFGLTSSQPSNETTTGN
eukprot:TRINITY_DN666_c0_g3_i2.p1 TRINITY_DN666_c0_g3~~TRINITY_DN666_c0_g3_i2.p1  ORF type:complete len:415 (+),score=115.68 TRINITY_DN666_c0_g3_i2:228-1472(+)